MKYSKLLLVASAFVFCSSILHAQVPQLINYQGRVVVGNTNFNGTGQFKFALVNGSNSSSTAHASVNEIIGGVIQHIGVNLAGNGYTSAPGVTITDSQGGGATATATVSYGRVTSINITNGGSNYSPSTSVTIASPPPTQNFTYWSNDGTSTNGNAPAHSVSINVINGLYSVLLGDTSLPNMTAVPNTVVYYSDVRLRVWFDDGVHGSQLLSPDQRIPSVGYAFGAAALGDTSTGAVIFTDANQLNLNAPGGIKLNTGGDGTGVTLTTAHGTQGNVLRVAGDINTAGKITAGKMVLMDTVFGGGSLQGNDAVFVNTVSAQQFITTSDRNAKQQFRPVNVREILSHLTSIPIQTWNFKQGDSGAQHIGPMAQDFYAAFQVGLDDKHITTVDADGVAFAAIQGLNEIVREQNAELAAKAKKIDALEKRLDQIERTLKHKTTTK